MNIDCKALIQLEGCVRERKITKQQYKTLRGQVFAGCADAAMKGLRKILHKQNERSAT